MKYETSLILPDNYYYRFSGQTGDWSDTQTITLYGSIPTATPTISSFSPNSSESQNSAASLSQSDAKTAGWLGLDWVWIAVFGVVAVLAAFIVLFLFKKRR